MNSKCFVLGFFFCFINTLACQTTSEDLRNKVQYGFEFIESDMDSAFFYMKEAEEMARTTGNLWQMGYAKLGFAYTYFKFRDYEKAYISTLNALDFFKTADTVDLHNTVSAYQTLSLIHSRFGDHERAVNYYEQSLDIYDRYVNEYPERIEQLAISRDAFVYSLSVEYSKLGDSQKEAELLHELWAIAQEKVDNFLAAKVLNKLGILNKEAGRLDSAEFYFRCLLDDDKIEKYRGYGAHNLAEVFSDRNELDSAEYYFREALAIKQRLGDNRSVFNSYVDLGEVYYEQEFYESAIEQWRLAIKLGIKVDSPKMLLVYDWLNKANRELGNDELADTYLHLYQQGSESYKNAASVIQAEEEREGFRNFLNGLEKGRMASGMRKNRIALILVFIAMAICTSVIIIYRRKSKKKRLYRELGDILLEDTTKS